MNTPIYNRLAKYYDENRISFAMPGHKSGRGFDADFLCCDVTELNATVNLFGNDKTIAEANTLLSRFYGTRKSFILTEGSTGAIKTMLCSALNPGDTLLVTSDCHRSVINACAIMGINLKFCQVGIDEDYCVPTGQCDLEITDDVDGVLVTSPNYYGVVKDIKEIAEKCHQKGVLLLVDEAHGAHFCNKYGLPQSATDLGADMVCQSAHKTLDALTGAAYLHICTDRVDKDRVMRVISGFHSSSPSYPIAASADYARAKLESADYSRIIGLCDEFKREVSEKTCVRVFHNDDATRTVLNFGEYDITGFRVSEILSEKYSIDVEMADLVNVVLIVTPNNTADDFIRLTEAIVEIVAQCTERKERIHILPPPVVSGVISPQNAWYGKNEKVTLEDSIGRISAVTVSVYPPATAVVVMGGVITESAVEYLDEMIKNGAEVVGIADGKIEVMV